MTDPIENSIVTVREEWRVDGRLSSGKPYQFIYSEATCIGDPESTARAFVSMPATNSWIDGPYLHKRTRTVTVSAWQHIATRPAEVDG